MTEADAMSAAPTNAPERSAQRRPILVTGAHRSGTTWVGRLLAQAPNTFYYHEPLNPTRAPGLGFHRAGADRWYVHITEKNARHYARQLDPILTLRGAPLSWSTSRRSLHGIRCLVSDWLRARRYRRKDGRALMKDPFALFSADWLARRYDMHIVIMVRHPAAFVSSVLRKGWTFDFRNWMEQDELMAGPLRPFAAEIEAATRSQLPLLEEAVLMWRACYATTDAYRRAHPDWLILRHEDLSLDPRGSFRALYAKLGLKYTDACRQAVIQRTDARNPADAVGRQEQHARNSAANVWSWKGRLTTEEISHVRRRVEDISSLFYSHADWDGGEATGIPGVIAVGE